MWHSPQWSPYRSFRTAGDFRFRTLDGEQAGAVGEAGYTAMQIATILGEHHVKVVPEIAVSGDGSSGMANVMLAKLVSASREAQK